MSSDAPPRSPASEAAAPRWTLAGLSLLHAFVFGWAAKVLPWHSWTLFAAATATLAALHLMTATLAFAGVSLRIRAWRVSSFASLIYLAYYSYVAASSATYLAALYGGLGRGVAAATAAVWAVLVLLTLPHSVWGLAVSGGLGPRRRATTVAGVLALLATAGLWRTATAATADPVAAPADAARELAAALAPALAELPLEPPASRPDRRLSLFTRAPAKCETAPSARVPTLIVTYLAKPAPPDTAPYRVRTRCLQREQASELPGALREALADAYARRPIKIDVITGVQQMSPRVDVVDSVSLRPALDGVCGGTRCLMPWQLAALDQFTTYTPLPFIDDLRFGIDPTQIAQALRGFRPKAKKDYDGPTMTIAGLTRVEVMSYLVDSTGTLRYAPRARLIEDTLTEQSLKRAVDDAIAHILAAQDGYGRFRYLLDPFTGRVSWSGFAIPRQAGTTLALCEVGDHAPEIDASAARSLDMLASIAHDAGDLSVLAYTGRPKKRKKKQPKGGSLGSTALPLISFLACRDRVGPKHDELIARMGRALLTLQRDNGSFRPWFNLRKGEAVEGPTPMYAEGQAVYALSLLEALALELGPGEHNPLPPVEVLREAVERAMQYTANDYWDHGLSDFYFLEENWHCLAAKASLGHHRNPGYEQFCLDYVTFKRRLILDEDTWVSEDLEGGYGFGNVLPPHNTPSGGFGEALAAAMELKRADGLDTTKDEQSMALVLEFLIRQQWNDDNCIACSPDHLVVGGFSESMASPIVRIDYTQHTLAALGRGGRLIGMLPPAEGA